MPIAPEVKQHNIGLQQNRLHQLEKPSSGSVRNCYHMLDSSINWVLWPWDKIWRNKAPLKVSCFSWIAAKEACFTQSNLQKRRIQLCSRCPLCEEHSEEVFHLFLHCWVTSQLWNMFFGNSRHKLDHA